MWCRALVLSVLLLLPAPSWAALAIDAVSSGAANGVTSLTYSHTVSGSDRLLIVWVSWYHTIAFITGVTYNGVAMTEIPSGSANSSNYQIAGYYLVSPALGTNNVVINFSQSIFGTGAGSLSFTGVDQTNPLGTAVAATGGTSTPSVTVSANAGEIVSDGLCIIHNGTLTVGGGQTQQWNAIDSGGNIKYAGSTEAGAASTTMSWSNSTAQLWAQGAVPVKPAASASTAVPLRTLLGSGL